MTDSGKARVEARSLRGRAAKRLDQATVRVPGPSLTHDPQQLLRELQVQQIELELQNEELRATREAAETGLARYSELFHCAPVGYASVGSDGCIREMNATGMRLLGEGRVGVIGEKFSSFVELNAQSAFDAFLARTELSGGGETCEVALRVCGIRPRHIRLSATLLPAARSVILLTFADITEQKEHEAKLAKAERALEESNRRRDEVLAVLSHELRGPLSPSRNGLYVLSRAEPGGEQAKRAQAILERQVAH